MLSVADRFVLVEWAHESVTCMSSGLVNHAILSTNLIAKEFWLLPLHSACSSQCETFGY